MALVMLCADTALTTLDLWAIYVHYLLHASLIALFLYLCWYQEKKTREASVR